MSEWYIIPATGGATQVMSEPEPLAGGDPLRVDRWTVSLTAPRIEVTMQAAEVPR